MSKTLLEIFNRYTPDDEARAILLRADPESIRLRADRPQRIIEAEAAFGAVIPKPVLYRIEEAIRSAYDLNTVHILPHYPKECFDLSVIPDLLIETNRRGIVANGFFNRCNYNLTDGRLDIEIPFTKSGLDLIYDSVHLTSVGSVNRIVLILTDHGLVCGNLNYVDRVDLSELIVLRKSSTCHTREL